MQVTDVPPSNSHSEVPTLVETFINGLVWAVCHTAVQVNSEKFGFKSTDKTILTCLFFGVMTFNMSSPFTKNLGGMGSSKEGRGQNEGGVEKLASLECHFVAH